MFTGGFLSGLEVQGEINQLLDELFAGQDQASPSEAGRERYAPRREVGHLREAGDGVKVDSDQRVRELTGVS